MTSDYADGGEPTPTRNLRRLRKHTVESKAAAAKEHAIDVAVEVKESDTEGLLSYKKWQHTFMALHICACHSWLTCLMIRCSLIGFFLFCRFWKLSS